MGTTNRNQRTTGLASAFDNTSLVSIILRRTQFWYSLVLLVTFLTGAAWYSAHNAKEKEDNPPSTVKGSGGTHKDEGDSGSKLNPHFGPAAKNFFRCIAAVLFLSYVGSGVSMFVHAFWYEDPYEWARKGLPWAGEWSVVCLPLDKRAQTRWTGFWALLPLLCNLAARWLIFA